MGKLVVIVIFSVWIFGCSSSGGGSDDAQDLQHPVLKYTGAKALAPITHENAKYFLFGFLNVFDQAYSSATIPDDPLDVWITEYNVESGDGGCNTGSIETVDNLDEYGYGAVEFRFKDCELLQSMLLESSTIFGVLDYEVSKELNEANLGYMRISSVFDTMEFKARSSATYDQVNIYDALFYSKKLDDTFRISNAVGKAGNFEGRLYVASIGYVEFSYDYYDHSLIFSGSTEQQLIVSYKKGYLENGDRLAWGFVLTIIDSSAPENALYLDGVSGEFLGYTYFFENNPPTNDDPSAEFSVDRLTSTVLDLSNISDANDDFLRVSWGEVALDGCEIVLTPAAKNTATFSSSCYGVFEVPLEVVDGRGGVLDTFIRVNVLPLPAQVGAIDIQQSDNFFEVMIEIENQDQDGPFEFSLSHAPEGITISSEGIVTGFPRAFIAQEQQQFSIGVEVDNGRSELVEFTLDLSSQAGLKKLFPQYPTCSWRDMSMLVDADGDSNLELLCHQNESFMVLQIADGIYSVDYVELNPYVGELLAVQYVQLDKDDNYEIIVSYNRNTIILYDDDYTRITQIDAPLSSYDSVDYDALFPAPNGMLGFVVAYNVPPYSENAKEIHLYDFLSGNFELLDESSEVYTSILNDIRNVDRTEFLHIGNSFRNREAAFNESWKLSYQYGAIFQREGELLAYSRAVDGSGAQENRFNLQGNLISRRNIDGYYFEDPSSYIASITNFTDFTLTVQGDGDLHIIDLGSDYVTSIMGGGSSQNANFIPVTTNSESVLNVYAVSTWPGVLSDFINKFSFDSTGWTSSVLSLPDDIRPSVKKIVDLDKDGVDELFVLEAQDAAVRNENLYLRIYNLLDGGLRLVKEYPLLCYSALDLFELKDISLSLQDVDGDGSPEALLFQQGRRLNGECDTSSYKGSSVTVFDEDFSVLNETNTEAEIISVPSIEGYSKRNLIAYSKPEVARNISRYVDDGAFSVFQEISLNDGKVIWESDIFLGDLLADSVLVTEQGIKAATTDAGIYFFE